MSLEKSKLILEYIKVAAWPIVALFVLAIFYKDISLFIQNIGSLEAGPLKIISQFSGTGKIKAERPLTEEAPSTTQIEQIMRGSPELWFDTRPLNISHSECLKRAEVSLTDSGFLDGGINNGTTVYGYDQQYVGAFWCIESPRLVFIVVSGPNSRIASDKVSRLVGVFESASP